MAFGRKRSPEFLSAHQSETVISAWIAERGPNSPMSSVLPGIVEHVVVVGLYVSLILHADTSHHARGPEIEYVYPPLSESTTNTETSSATPSSPSKPTKTSPVPVPESWHLLPFMALPDGAHMVARPSNQCADSQERRGLYILHASAFGHDALRYIVYPPDAVL